MRKRGESKRMAVCKNTWLYHDIRAGMGSCWERDRLDGLSEMTQ